MEYDKVRYHLESKRLRKLRGKLLVSEAKAKVQANFKIAKNS